MNPQTKGRTHTDLEVYKPILVYHNLPSELFKCSLSLSILLIRAPSLGHETPRKGTPQQTARFETRFRSSFRSQNVETLKMGMETGKPPCFIMIIYFQGPYSIAVAMLDYGSTRGSTFLAEKTCGKWHSFAGFHV